MFQVLRRLSDDPNYVLAEHRWELNLALQLIRNVSKMQQGSCEVASYQRDNFDGINFIFVAGTEYIVQSSP